MDIRVLEFSRKFRKDKPLDSVLIAPAHSVQTSQTWHRVDHINPENLKEYDGSAPLNAGDRRFHLEAMWSVVKPHYEAWLKGEEIPEDGTALAAWAGVDASQARELKAAGIRTVEELSTITDAAMARVKLPDVRRLREQAALFLDGKGANEMAEALAATNEKLEAALAVIAEMQEASPPKRGRPKKAEAA